VSLSITYLTWAVIGWLGNVYLVYGQINNFKLDHLKIHKNYNFNLKIIIPLGFDL